MRVIVTRPAAQAAEWVGLLRAQGLDAVALPLIGIAAIDDPEPLAAAWQALPHCRLAMFVSANAAQHFFAHRPAGQTWPASVQAASPGPGTTQALVASGVPADAIVEPAADAAQFDSEALWLRLQTQDWRAAGVLVVRGEGGREWLIDRLVEAGAHVTPVVSYRRVAPHLSAGEQAVLQTALAAPEQHLWFFSSSEAIGNLASLVAPTHEWSRALALATHPRIAARARQLGIACVLESRPALNEVIACIQSIRP